MKAITIKVDQEAVKLLAHYRDELLPKKMKTNNAIYKVKHFYQSQIISMVMFSKRYNVEWIGREGLAPETHEEYLNDFINHFYKNGTWGGRNWPEAVAKIPIFQ